MKRYPLWTCKYANEDLDRTGRLAQAMGDKARESGQPICPYGWTREQWDRAFHIVTMSNLQYQPYTRIKPVAKGGAL